jgi:hypothetical protein
MGTIRCAYTCPACGLTDSPLDVEAYVPNRDGIDVWVKAVVVRAIAADHAARAPLCPGPSSTPPPALPSRGWWTAAELGEQVTVVFKLADIDPSLARRRRDRKVPWLVCKVRLPRR